MSRITLLTDFGTQDGYVGAMKGVMASLFPGVSVDDVSHAVAPGDVRGASIALARYWRLYPSGTVHLVVVDPGVGTERKALAVEADRRLFVAPDNGVLSGVLSGAEAFRAVEIRNAGYMMPVRGDTFHGRDIFAPAAAYLARGAHLSRLGPPMDSPLQLSDPEVLEEDGAFLGQVISLDRFGNLVTNLDGTIVDVNSSVEVDGHTLQVVRTYGDVAPRELAALVNSDGRLEVAARDTSAAELLNATIGTRVRVRPIAGKVTEAGVRPV